MTKVEYDGCINLMCRMVDCFNTLYGTMDELDFYWLNLIFKQINLAERGEQNERPYK